MRITLILALIVAACAHVASSSDDGNALTATYDPLATLERTACYGFCPVYKVTIFRDGIVEYVGERFVKTRGPALGRLSAAQLAQLRRLFQRSGYLRFMSSYLREDVTDLPYVYTSYSPFPGRTKSVRHYLGDRSAPRALTAVEEGIDRIVNIEQWIGTPEERRELPPT